MHRGQLGGPVKRRSDGFAVERDHGALGELGDGLGPRQETLMEGFGIKTGKDAPEGVMRGDAIGQVEKLFQPRLFAFLRNSRRMLL